MTHIKCSEGQRLYRDYLKSTQRDVMMKWELYVDHMHTCAVCAAGMEAGQAQE